MQKRILNTYIKQIFNGSPESIEFIASHFEYKEFKKETFLLKQGEINNNLFLINSGIVRAFTIDSNEMEITTNFYSKANIVFEASSFLMRTKSIENLQALTEVNGFNVTFDSISTLSHTSPDFREFGRAMIALEFAKYKQLTLNLKSKNVEENYLSFIDSNLGVLQNVPLKFIASFLGITDTSLSRLRSRIMKK